MRNKGTRQQERIAIIGEGITEVYFIKSLAEVYPQLSLFPQYPKHSSLKSLKKKIDEVIDAGYRKIYCLIDMDTKRSDSSEYAEYRALKANYNSSNKVHFIESDRCTEIIFLYYFRYTGREYTSQNELLADLNQLCSYEKNEDFFRTHPLHIHFEKHGGSIANAISNSIRSMNDHADGRPYTYTEFASLISEIVPKK